MTGRATLRRLKAFASLAVLAGWSHAVAAGPQQAPSRGTGQAAGAPEATAPESGAPTADPAAREVAPSGLSGFLRQTAVTGFVDAYYSWSSNAAPPVEFRNFDVTHGQLRFSAAEIAFDKKAVAASRLGFRLDVGGGPAADIVNAAEPGGADHWKAIQQAYVSYLVPVGRGLTVDAGKFVTPLGAEVIETRDNWNYSRSVLFAAAIPYYHFGARLAYPLGGAVTLTGLVVNGWNGVEDNNDATTVGLSATFAPASRLTIAQHVLAGREQPGEAGGVRRVFNSVVTLAATSRIAFMGDVVVGRDSVDGVPRRWHGIAGYARLQPTEWFAVAPRLEWYGDPDGFTTGVAQTVREVTVTGEFKTAGVVARLEVRRDVSSAASFASAREPRRSRTTLAVGVLYAFARPGR